MRCSPDLWLTVVAIAACGSGYPTMPQLHDIIKEILFEDVLFQDILSERIKLNDTDLPPLIRDSLQNIADLDPLVALHQLSKPTEFYSGQDLAASTKVVGTALKCLTFKRLAVHVVLIKKMIVLQTEKKANQARLQVFTNLIPHDVDMLMTVNENQYMDLLGLLNVINEMLTKENEDIGGKENLDVLDGELTKINQTIESSCVQHDMSVYFKQLHIATESDLQMYPEVISDLKIVDSVSLDTVIQWVKENENDVLDLYDLLYFLRTMSLGTWKSLLKHADMPTDEAFTRRPLSNYRQEIRKILSSRFQVTADIVAKNNDIEKAEEVPVDMQP